MIIQIIDDKVDGIVEVLNSDGVSMPITTLTTDYSCCPDSLHTLNISFSYYVDSRIKKNGINLDSSINKLKELIDRLESEKL